MKRWLVVIALVILLAAAALTVKVWLPPLLTFVGANTDVIQGLESLAQLALWAMAVIVGVAGYLRGRQSQPSPQPEPVPTRTINTGGGIYVEGDVKTAGGDFVGRDQNINITLAQSAQAFLGPLRPKLSKDSLQKATEAYFNTLLDRHRYLNMKGMGVSDRVPLKLPLLDLYIPLKARLELPEGETWKREGRLAGRELTTEEARALRLSKTQLYFSRLALSVRAEEARALGLSVPQPALELLKKQSGLIVLGDPGAGKTTFLKFLTLRLALGEGQSLGLGNRLPILTPLSAYANALSERDVRLDDFISRYFHDIGSDLPIAGMLAEALKAGAALVLLDGLDEVKDLRLRHTVVERAVDFYTFHRRAGNKFVITSRVVGYAAVRPVVEGLAECMLIDLDDAEVEQFVRRWTSAMETQAQGDTATAHADAERERRELLEAIQRNPGVRNLAANPLLLTILALMKRQGITLPERRVELYDKYVEALLSSWNRARGLGRPPARDLDVVQTVRVLAPLALWMHEVSPGVGLVKREDLRRKLESIYRDRGEPDPEAAAHQFMTDVREHAGLLLERGHDEYGFIHLTFEEYLAAVAIALRHQGDANAIAAVLSEHVGDPAWREVALLTVGYVGIRQQLDQVAGAVVEILAKGESGKAGQGAVLAGQAVIDTLGGVPSKSRELVISALISTMQDERAPRLVRRDAGLVLGRLGWTPGDLDVFLPVPAGKFLYGDDKQEREFKNPYWIAKYPVTNLQYRRFIDEGGYKRKEWWGEEGWKWLQKSGYTQPRDFDSLEFGNAIFPAVSLSWYEADAYTRWLNSKLTTITLEGGHTEPKPANYVVRLLSEEEWERAARGTDDRTYPWGDRFDSSWANTEESNVERQYRIGTTAICTYPQGISPVGAWDMSGNVREWVASSVGEYRALRGGSWSDNARFARCAYRHWYVPTNFSDHLGFRMCVALAFSEF